MSDQPVTTPGGRVKLPELNQPTRYQGLYVVDFGEWTAVGYTAEEVAVLLEREAYRNAKVYKIVRAAPDGQMELRGVDLSRFQVESGMFFVRRERQVAAEDFEDLTRLAQDGIPCRAFVHLADRGPAAQPYRYVTALVYPAEYDEEVARWLLDVGFLGGDLAEGGVSHVNNYYNEQNSILRREQLWSRNAISSRSADEVLATVRQAVQR